MSIPQSVERTNRRFIGREWTVAEVVRWRDETEAPVFLLTGPPGYGKTALAAWLAGAGPLPEDSVAAAQLNAVRRGWHAVHFCSRDAGRGSADPRRFARSLTEQLQRSVPELPTYAAQYLAPRNTISQHVERNLGTAHAVGTLSVTSTSVEEAFDAGVHAPLTSMVEHGVTAPILLLVDGLDDALDGRQGATVVDLLASLLDLAPPIRMLLTCRPDDRVQGAFDRDGRAETLELDGPDLRDRCDDDIRQYVQARLDEATAGGAWPDGAREDLVGAAEGNFQYAEFLIDEILLGLREPSDATGLPAGLDELYTANLQRLQRTRSISTQRWEDLFRPLLGLVAVSDPVAPRAELAEWVPVEDPGAVAARADELRQIMPYEADLDGWRLFHRSMREFLFTPQMHDGGRARPNRYYISAATWHRRIAQYYLNQVDKTQLGWSSLGSYGLGRLVYHLSRAWATESSPADRETCLAELAKVVLDPKFRAAQRSGASNQTAVADDARAALEVFASAGRVSQALRLVRQLAVEADPAVQVIAVEWLVHLHRQAPEAVLAAITAMLDDRDAAVWRTALRAAYEIGESASPVFEAIARATGEDRDELRRAAGLALTLRWRPGPDDFTGRLLHSLATSLLPVPGARNSKLLEFVGEVSIAIYINNCDNREVTESTARLWRFILTERMRLGPVSLRRINHWGLDRLLARAATRVYSKRILESALFSGVADPAAFFSNRTEAKAVALRSLPLLSPGATVDGGAEDDLARLLAADLPLLRVVACMVIAVQMHARPDDTAVVVRRLARRLSGRARLWLVLAFSAPLAPPPNGWPDLAEELTVGLLTEEPSILDLQDEGTLPTFDLLLLAAGRALGTVGRPLTPLLTRMAAGDVARLSRMLRAWGPVGIYHPTSALEAIHAVLPESRQQRPLPGLVECLGTIRAVHPELVDLFCKQVRWPGLREAAQEASDLRSVWQYIWWLGLYKNAVHQAVHYPRMRSQLLVGGLTALLAAQSPQELIRNFAVVPLRMLRKADYDLLRWTEP